MKYCFTICVFSPCLAGLPDARGQLREDCQDHRDDCDPGVADHRLIYARLDIFAGTRLVRSDAGPGLDVGEGVDAGDFAAGM